MRDFIVTLLCLSAGGSVLALALLAMRWLCGQRLTGRFYYYVWLIVLLRFVLPIPGLVTLPDAAPRLESGQSAAYAEPAAPQGVNSPAPEINLALTAESVTGRPRPSTNYLFNAASSHRTSAASAPEQAASAAVETESGQESGIAPKAVLSGVWQGIRALLSSWALWFAVWAAGAVISFTHCVAGYLRFSKTLRRTERMPRNLDLELYFSMPGRRKPGLIRSRAVASPVLMGLFNPVIVLPDRCYTPEMLNNIFAHELAHYRRGDIAYKWFAAFVSALHWFNPLVYIMRREIDRACELSCDELVLRRMSADEKRSYGETLLALAAGAISPSVMATSFATQKRNLKERLSQIVNFKARSAAAVVLSLFAAVLLVGCGVALGPNTAQSGDVPAKAAAAPSTFAAAQTEAPVVTPMPTPVLKPEPDAAMNVEQDAEIEVSTVDEFLSAIGSDRTIVLAPGTYDLSTAADYGAAKEKMDAPYFWAEVYDGYKLSINGVSGLKIMASGDADIVPGNNYASVLTLENSTDVSLEGLKIGHAELDYNYNSSALQAYNCAGLSVTDCELYNNGDAGIRCYKCADVSISDSNIHDCGYSAVASLFSLNVRVDGCDIHDCARSDTPAVFTLRSTSFVLNDCRIHDNKGTGLISIGSSGLVYILGCDVSQGNEFAGQLFGIYSGDVYVAGCLFDGTSTWPRIAAEDKELLPLGMDGSRLTSDDIFKMQLTQIDLPGNALEAAFIPPELEKTVNAEGYTVVNVSTVDEFLAAIDSKTIINLAPGTYDLSTASNYGSFGSRRYRWDDVFGVSELVVMGVKDLHIVGDTTAEEETKIISESHAYVMGFRTCSDIFFDGVSISAKEGSEYMPDALSFNYVDNVSISRCKLYDCLKGILASECSSVSVSETEIFNCKYYAVSFTVCEDLSFTDCNIHDCGTPEGNFVGCENVTYNNTPLKNGDQNLSGLI